MVEDGVAISLSVIIIILVTLIILYISGVFGSSESSCEPCKCDSAQVDTVYDYTPGVRPFDGYSIKDTDDPDKVSSRAAHWSDLWGKNLA